MGGGKRADHFFGGGVEVRSQTKGGVGSGADLGGERSWWSWKRRVGYGMRMVLPNRCDNSWSRVSYTQ